MKIVSGPDFPFKFGLYMHDRYIFAQDRVRFVGEQVAAVIARDPAAALKAAGPGESPLQRAAAGLDHRASPRDRRAADPSRV